MSQTPPLAGLTRSCNRCQSLDKTGSQALASSKRVKETWKTPYEQAIFEFSTQLFQTCLCPTGCALTTVSDCPAAFAVHARQNQDDTVARGGGVKGLAPPVQMIGEPASRFGVDCSCRGRRSAYSRAASSLVSWFHGHDFWGTPQRPLTERVAVWLAAAPAERSRSCSWLSGGYQNRIGHRALSRPSTARQPIKRYISMRRVPAPQSCTKQPNPYFIHEAYNRSPLSCSIRRSAPRRSREIDPNC